MSSSPSPRPDAHPTPAAASPSGANGDASLELIHLTCGDAHAAIAPTLGCCIVSWVVDGIERLALPLPLEQFARAAKTGGIPLLHPFANRLRNDRWERNGQAINVGNAPGLKRDANGLPIHGHLVRFAGWTSIESHTRSKSGERAHLEARLAWNESLPFFEAFPFRHTLEVSYDLGHHDLVVTTRVSAVDVPVPIALGWHPYFSFAGSRRNEVTLGLCEREHIALDERMLPQREHGNLVVKRRWPESLLSLEGCSFDDLFRVGPNATVMLRSRAGTLRCTMPRGYRFLQVYAPLDAQFVCLEPMTAPGAALSDGQDLPEARVGEPHEAVFRLDLTS